MHRSTDAGESSEGNGRIDTLVHVATLREWRRSSAEAWWALLGYVVGFFVIASVVISAMDDHPSTADVVGASTLLVGVSSGAAILAYRVFAHARLRATVDGIVVSNPFRSDQFVSWANIDSMSPDRLLVVRRTDGGRVIVWAVQKNGWSRARQLRSSSDEVIDELSRLASQQLSAPREFASR
jgi:hypothetical protein